MKKVISVLLCLILSFSTVSTALAAEKESEEYPIITVTGMLHDIVDKEGKLIFPTTMDIGEHLKSILLPLTTKFIKAYATDNWNDYAEEFANAIEVVFSEIQLEGDNVIKDGSGSPFKWTKETLLNKTSDYGTLDYFFEYDWRVSSYDIADLLNDYINDILAVTGKKKVNLVGRCLGANVIMAYFETYGTEKINTYVSHVGGPQGNAVISSLFTGNLDLNPDNLDTFVTSYANNFSVFPDPALQALVAAFVSLINEVKLLGLGTDAIISIYNELKVTVMPRMLRNTFGSFATVWDCVNYGDYEEAKDFVFNTPELKKEYAGLLEKTDRYNENVKKNINSLLLKYSNDINIEVIAKYNSDIYPIFEGSERQGDGLIELENISYGATAVNLGETLSDSYIKEREALGYGKYISKDNIIDASTCLFPDHTWFIRDMEHRNWQQSVEDMILEIIKSDGKMTVFTNEKYPQFIDYNHKTGELSPVTDLVPKEDDRWNRGFMQTIIMFFITLVEFIKSIFIK